MSTRKFVWLWTGFVAVFIICLVIEAFAGGTS